MIRSREVKTALNKLKKRDSWFLAEYTVNPYEGCSCNCLYCYIRGSKYGENMADTLSLKSNVLPVLEKQLKSRSAKSQYGFVAVGSATDAYIPHEKDLHVTEGILKLLFKYRFPVFLSTKRQLIIRDVELLKQIDKTAIIPPDLRNRMNNGVVLSVSISTMNETITNLLEPNASTPMERLELVKQLKEEGFLVGVNAIPILPYISDGEKELERIIESAASYSADYILIGGLTLFGKEPADSRTLYYRFLRLYDASLIERYDHLFGENNYAPAAYHSMLKARGDAICKKYNLRTKILA